MGRSVDYLNNATLITYLDAEKANILDEYDWEAFIEGITDQLIASYPSLESADRWDGRETHIFLENGLVEIGVSEYCGLISLSIRPKDDDYEYSDTHNRQAFGLRWIAQVEKTFLALGNLRRVGGMSNGEGVYAKN